MIRSIVCREGSVFEFLFFGGGEHVVIDDFGAQLVWAVCACRAE